MIGYVTIGALDVEAATPFYDAVLGAIGYERKFLDGGWAGYGPRDAEANTFVCPPENGRPAQGGNGIMIAFKGVDNASVDAAYAAALAHGGSDEGAPGPRPPESTSFYAAYMRDPTGNKFAVFAKA